MLLFHIKTFLAAQMKLYTFMQYVEINDICGIEMSKSIISNSHYQEIIELKIFFLI
jgi:hypothetical protein